MQVLNEINLKHKSGDIYGAVTTTVMALVFGITPDADGEIEQ